MRHFKVFEALFENINHEEMRIRLKEAGATLVKERTLHKRVTLNFPKEKHSSHKWLRVRTNGEKTTIALKMLSSETIEGQHEIEFEVSSFHDAVELLIEIGAVKKSFQETYRETWNLLGTEIILDSWPFLPDLIEIEGESPEAVEKVSKLLGLDWSQARFCSSSTLYAETYNVSEEYFNNEIAELRFDGQNPF